MTRAEHMNLLSKFSIHRRTLRSPRRHRLMLAGVCMFAFGDALGKLLVASYPVSQLLLLRAACRWRSCSR